MQSEKVNFLTLLTNWIEEKIIFILYKIEEFNFFIYRRPTLYPLEIAVDFLKSL